MVEKVTIIKKLARIGISIPLFLLIIIIWTYFTIKAAQPEITDTVGSSITNCSIHSTKDQCNTDDVCDWNGSACENACYKPDKQNEKSCKDHKDCEWTGSTCKEDTSWNPFNTFCQAQATSVGQTAPTKKDTISTEKAQAKKPCPNSNQKRYSCGRLPKGVNINKGGFCKPGTYPDKDKTWCDDPNLPSMTTSDGKSILSYHANLQCCKEHIYESNINYVGLVGYLLLTLPFIYFLIEKIVAVFIYYKPDELIEDSQFEFVGDYISKNGGKYVAWAIAIYYIILPMFRFIFVSYKCEDVNQNKNANCGKPCSNSGECATLHGQGCTLCVNNVCESPDFSSSFESKSRAKNNISVCGLRSILNDLSENEINEIYLKYVPSGKITLSIQAKKQAINNALTTEEKHKMATIEFYKFIPRQEIAINDTSTPFRLTLPNPSSYKTGNPPTKLNTITGFNYALNNFLHLDIYEPPKGHKCDGKSESKSEIKCNKNHNCKYVKGRCVKNECVDINNKPSTRYSLPDITGINSTQDISDLSLHNKVIRGGRENNVDNIYPCNDVSISQLQNSSARSSLINSNYKINAKMDSWINHFELNRYECADKQGQCYMDDYICKTKLGVPIPLTYVTSPVKKVYTIGEVSTIGCQTALYPCQKDSDPCDKHKDKSSCTSSSGRNGSKCKFTQGSATQPSKCESSTKQTCTSLDYNPKTGYLLEKANGGYCTPVVWDNNTWRKPTSSDTNSKHMCIPIDKKLPINSSNKTIPGAEVGSWKKNLNKPGGQINSVCKSVKRVPSSSVKDTSITNPYYRWSAKGTLKNPLCSDSTDTCKPPKIKDNTRSYNPPNISFNDGCCIDPTTSGQQSLYITGKVESGTMPKKINNITPTVLSG